MTKLIGHRVGRAHSRPRSGAVTCAASAMLASIDPSTAGNLEGRLGLEFQVKQPTVLGLILVGGSTLLALRGLTGAVAAMGAYQAVQPLDLLPPASAPSDHP